LLWADRGISADRGAVQWISFIKKYLMSEVVLSIMLIAAIGCYIELGIDGVEKVLQAYSVLLVQPIMYYLFYLSPVGFLLEHNRFYGITDKRVVIAWSSSSKYCDSVYPDELCDPFITHYPNGRADILISTTKSLKYEGSNNHQIELVGIRNAENVTKIIVQTFLSKNNVQKTFTSTEMVMSTN